MNFFFFGIENKKTGIIILKLEYCSPAFCLTTKKPSVSPWNNTWLYIVSIIVFLSQTVESTRAQDKIDIEHLTEMLAKAKEKAERDKEALKKATR